MRVALCIIATGKYLRFVRPLIESAQDYFFNGQERVFLVFTDATEFQPPSQTIIQHTPYRPWPGPTLYRYHTMLGALEYLRSCDYAFYCDADMRFVGCVAEEICGDGLTAVQHPGYVGVNPRRLTYERRRKSRAYIAPGDGVRYYAGGFQGGRVNAWLTAMEDMAEAVDDDTEKGITAIWHDESHWNRLLAHRPPAITLPATYCCPETWPMDGRRIVALDKNHTDMRA